MTQEILEQMTQKNPRLKWFHSERPNYGVALKAGIQKARGEIVVCDEIDLCDLVFYDAVGAGAPGRYPHAFGLGLAFLLALELVLAALTFRRGRPPR